MEDMDNIPLVTFLTMHILVEEGNVHSSSFMDRYCSLGAGFMNILQHPKCEHPRYINTRHYYYINTGY